MLDELRKVIPSFLTRVDRPDRGGAWSAYLEQTRAPSRRAAVHRMFAGDEPEPRPAVTLTDFDPDGEDKVLAAICYPHAALPEDQVLGARAPPRRPTSAVALLARLRRASATTAATARAARSSAPTTASTCSPTTARSATCSATACSRSSGRRCRPGTATTSPTAIDEAGLAATGSRRRWRARPTSTTRSPARFPEQASYAVSLAYRVRFVMQMNAREAMHLLELRTSPQGHPAYRQVCQEMHRLIAEEAGHRALAAAMRYVDHDDLRARAPRRRSARPSERRAAR